MSDYLKHAIDEILETIKIHTEAITLLRERIEALEKKVNRKEPLCPPKTT